MIALRVPDRRLFDSPELSGLLSRHIHLVGRNLVTVHMSLRRFYLSNVYNRIFGKLIHLRIFANIVLDRISLWNADHLKVYFTKQDVTECYPNCIKQNCEYLIICKSDESRCYVQLEIWRSLGTISIRFIKVGRFNDFHLDGGKYSRWNIQSYSVILQNKKQIYLIFYHSSPF